jgi:hypothetical protein
MNFVISADGSKIAWSATGIDPNDQNIVLSDLWVADVTTGKVTTLASESTAAPTGGGGGQNRGFLPVRFSKDN